MKKQVAKGSLQLHHLELSNRKTTGSAWDRDRMKRFLQIVTIVAVCSTITAPAPAAEDAAMSPGAAAQPATGPGGLPALPQFPNTPPQPGAIPSLQVLNQPAQPAQTPSSAIAGLQPLTAGLDALTTATDTSATPSGSGVALALNAFLFRDDQKFEKVMRNRMSAEEAEKAKQNEIEILRNKRQTQGAQPGGMGMAPMGDPYGSPYGAQGNPQQAQADSLTAAAEFDFYFQQLELYDRYLREEVLTGLDEEEMPDEPTYEASNYLQEGVTLQDAFNKAALTQVTKQQEENLEFMERLKQREDRRDAFANWVQEKRKELDEWTHTWSNNVNGTRWIGGDNVVRLNDWYYGINFNSPQPINFSIEDKKFLVSRTPQRDVPEDTLNILSTNLTPFDIISKDGYVKDIATERLKGTAVKAPREAPREGTIEITD